MGETIKVKISEDGLSAKEVNRLGGIPSTKGHSNEGWANKMWKWNQAEKNLRTFDVIKCGMGKCECLKTNGDVVNYACKEPGCVCKAIVINNRTIEIIK